MDGHAHILVSGMVQGVGFRFFVSRLARKLQLTGWVRNLPSGEVEIDTEGPRGLVESLVKDLSVGNSWAKVNHVDVQWEKYTGKHDGFDITY